MSRSTTTPTNFIRQIVEEDLVNRKYNLIRTRFPPEPNGYLHIGHAKSICLNFGIAEDYQGQCNLRFDDTNPIKENIEFIDSIKRDVQWLGFQWYGNVRYASDFFEEQHNYAIELIKKGLAYVDELSPDLIRQYRGTLRLAGTNSPYRSRGVEENLRLFSDMRKGKFPEGAACLRAKIDMSSSFMVLRDPVLYRIKFVEHHQTGYQWCIYPMYDFAHCISDAIEGITHSLCTLEFQDNRRLYNWVLDNISISTRPKQYEFSRLNIEYTVMSKRQLQLLVTQNLVDGWDDPRMPTISGMRRRGYTPESIREFCRRIGVTKQDNLVEMEALESCVREHLNEHALRAMAVLRPILIHITNLPKDYEEIIYMQYHPNKPSMGIREVPFTNEIYIDKSDFLENKIKNYKRLILGEEVRLRNAYIIKAEKLEKDNEGNIICLYCSCDLKTLNKKPHDGRTVKGVIHWVSAKYSLPAEFRLYEKLFICSNPLKDENLCMSFNPNSLVIQEGFVELSLKTAQVSLSYQFEREGYFCLDSIYSMSNKLVFNRTISLRNRWLGDKYANNA
ncbi:glutamine--tRNA ligase [Candidatus Erwinia haradaeae]|uniref:Glutamine--tRNA ligase n=1 Tax=Candidatus Erwinia haradaeae TaxID=1922217 RepID=A0A451D839_9GAMM|nr:glutamine--tRNA ligase [Candidatus Erwinia haradaeae]VFP82011.1 Glutamine--tRNA ligase [Candidatus Erwinia haradaeae]